MNQSIAINGTSILSALSVAPKTVEQKQELDILRKEQINKWLNRDYSWSQHSSFRDYNKEDWYKKYILGEETPSNKRMEFGSTTGKRIEKDKDFLPQIPRGGVMEYKVRAKMGDFYVIGYLDQFFKETPGIDEYKTSSPTGWDQKKVDKHDQFTFYTLLLALKNNIKPESLLMRLYHLHTEEKGDFSIGFASPFAMDVYETKRTMKQISDFSKEIVQIRKEMLEYALNHE